MDSATKPSRRNTICPACRFSSATHVARTLHGALYRCANIRHKAHRRRSVFFEGPAPKPLTNGAPRAL